jgi:hypothetical protein
MGLNAQTAVPVFTAGQVLTAAQVTQINTGTPVFATTVTRDAAFGGAGEKTLAQGQFCYLESTGKLQVYTGSAWSNVGSQTNVAAFTASGTWTVPAGVTYAIANIRAGGGGAGDATAGNGGSSSVAFAGGTITAAGGGGFNSGFNLSAVAVAGPANSGSGASYQASVGGAFYTSSTRGAQDGALITAGGAVTAGASITITVGAGGAAGTSGAAGGSGYIYITYEV